MSSSSLSTAQVILTVSQYYTICISFIILFSGIFGHMTIIFVLTHLKIFRNNPSAFYLIAESVVDLLQIIIILTSRIAMNGFANDLTQASSLWCELRALFVQSLTLISLNIVCFAAIDQYLSTTKILTIIAIIIWILHGTPVFFFFKIQSTYGCYVYNLNFLNYVTYFYYLILTGILPIIISTFFSVLAYQNVRRIVRRHMPIRRRKLDQQLTAMILVRIVFFVVMILPYILQRIFTLGIFIKNDNVIYQAIIQLIGAIIISFFHLNYTVC
ncbi:unnamed protein product [Rotaria sp. Silwood2]|nr:unnamed protein product [Rotaria sp. Silwood2]